MQAKIKLYKIVGATLSFSPTTSLLMLNKAEINNVKQQYCTVSPNLTLSETLHVKHNRPLPN